MDYKSLLNENQYLAASTKSQYSRVIAGAGSGKTRVLTYRLSFLISECGARPNSILAIAFTNKVANEMKNRALNILGDLGVGLSVSTFHSFCARFLRYEIEVLGYSRNFNILDEEDTETLIKNIASDMGYQRGESLTKYAISFIARNKCEGRYPDDVITPKHHDSSFAVALNIFKEYENRKDKMQALDFDDLLLKTAIILRNNDNVRLKWNRRIRHILIDEFQDVNDVQYGLIKLLMDNTTSLYVVGDPDQTIYTWRGANQDIIMNFDKDFPKAETIILDRNYRSTKPILEAANALIAHNKKRVPKNLYTNNDNGEPVSVNKTMSADTEAAFVVKEINYLHKKGVPYNDIAVLYRASHITRPLEEKLTRERIPYSVYGGMKFFQRKEVKDVLAYLRLFYYPKDDISFERIINVPSRKIGSTSLEVLKEEKNNLNISYLEYLLILDKDKTSLRGHAYSSLIAFRDSFLKTKKRLDDNLEAYPKIFEDYINELGYIDYLNSLNDSEKAEERIENVQALFGSITSFLKEYSNASFIDYLENASLQSSQDEIVNSDNVTLMTIHVAKGLEYRYVFVISVNEGLFPSHRTLEECGSNGLEEERRLCYVAFTRAKEKLYVSSNTGYSYVLGDYAKTSQFIEEAGLTSDNYYIKKPSSENNYFHESYDDGWNNEDFSSDDDVFEKEEPKTNGISDWQIGDIAIHEVFGRGIVKDIIDGVILSIEFDNCGTKSIIANHFKLSRGN